jgi:hypothetical protein
MEVFSLFFMFVLAVVHGGKNVFFRYRNSRELVGAQEGVADRPTGFSRDLVGCRPTSITTQEATDGSVIHDHAGDGDATRTRFFVIRGGAPQLGPRPLRSPPAGYRER